MKLPSHAKKENNKTMNIISDYNFCLLLADMEFDSEHVIGTQVLIKTDILENSYYFLLSISEVYSNADSL
jgi:hypothetical protein